MIAEVDDDGNGTIEFGEFLELISSQKVQSRSQRDDDSDTIEAFVAMGGASDKSGQVKPEVLTRALRSYGLTLDIPLFLAETDLDGSGQIDYEEFKAMMLPGEG